MIRHSLIIALALTSACVLPRSAVIGQTAAPIGAGNAEIGVSPGLGLQIDNAPPTVSGNTSAQLVTTSLVLPNFESNAQFGVTDWLGINLHLSPAGIQPGVKVNVATGNFSLAFLPELAFGVATTGTSTTTTTGANSTSVAGNTNYYFSVLAGAKVLVSHQAGFYGGLGYDFQSLSTSVVDGKGFNRGSGNQTASVLSLGLGWNFQLSSFAIRPEVDVLYLPANSTSSGNGTTSTSLSGGSGLVFFPNVTFAVASGKSAATAPKEPEGMKPEELSLPPLMRAP